MTRSKWPRQKPITDAGVWRTILDRQKGQTMMQEQEAKLVAAHQAGVKYWNDNRAVDATPDALASCARSLGWHGDLCDAWVAGFLGARSRRDNHMKPLAGESWIEWHKRTHSPEHLAKLP